MPSVAEAFALAVRHHQTGNLHQAEHLYNLILRADPCHFDVHHLLGLLACQVGRHDQAVASIRRALALNPQSAAFHADLGVVLAGQGKVEEAVTHYWLALDLDPHFAEAHNSLANALMKQGQLHDAALHLREALRRRPDFAEAHNNLGVVLVRQEKTSEAVAQYRQALRVNPHYPEAHNNLGLALVRQGRLDDAMAHYHKSIELRPNYGEAHWNRSLLWLLRGDFEQGWQGYEWRRMTKAEFTQRVFSQPYWDGKHLGGRTILLYAEQGLGDTVQFIRYVSAVKERGGRVIFECQAALLPLLASLPGIDVSVGRGSPLPAFEVQAPLLSLPRIFHTSLATIPSDVPYLRADPTLVDYWRRELTKFDVRGAKCDVNAQPSNLEHRTSHIARGFKVGIAWQGSATYRYDRQRSIPLAEFARLAAVPGVELISLQKGAGADQLTAMAGQIPIFDLSTGLDETIGGFMDTAAVMQNLDLVISSDTAIPHLAGALGVPVWVALPQVPDWRWLLDREESPWYPTMRVFRQTREGDWADVFARMAAALKRAKDEMQIKHG
jgi:Flp pilus assembly protein TadD